MIPRIAGKGTSFKGAGLYYLHDKQADTAERVAFTQTVNLPTDNPELALNVMAHTAKNQDRIKAAYGSASTGRKLSKSVYAYSLSWHPDERPEQAEMLAAARDTMKVLGLEDHEALLVIHNDEPHPHIHIIANRVNPTTGIAAPLSNDKLKLSQWAEAYEKSQGKVLCEQRVENNAKRNQGQFVKDLLSKEIAEFHAWRKTALKQAFDKQSLESANLSATQKGQRQFLYDEKEARITYRRQQVKEANKPKWADLYKRQRQEVKELRQAQAGALSRFKYWIQHRDKAPQKGFLGDALKAITGRLSFDQSLAGRHEAERKALSKAVKQQTLEAIQEENEAYRLELAELDKLQREESDKLKDQHARQSKDLNQQIDERSDYIEGEKEQNRLVDEFLKRASDRIRKRKKRDEQQKGKGQDRERD